MKTQKLIVRILVILALLICTSAALAFDAFYSAPSRFTTRYETISSIYIPSQMDDVNILFFSDLDYGTFMDEERLNKLIETINSLSADAVIFGGDLYDQDAGTITDEEIATVSAALKSITAPLGKFAVLGDFDYADDARLQSVKDTLYSGDFELLVNTSISLRNEGSQSITLVGLDSGLRGTPDITAAYANASPTSFVMTVCHTPDTADDVPADTTKYFLAGHSLGGQAYYFFDALYTPEESANYFRGKHTVSGSFTLDITNGVGTTIKDVRFLSNAEVVVYRLQHKTIASE